MKDRFSYIVPPSPTSTVDVDSYHPTSNWQNGQWQYQDLSYLLHNPALRLPIERPMSASASSRVAPTSQPAPTPAPEPTPATPEPSSSGLKDESNSGGSKVGWYVAGGLLLAVAVAGYAYRDKLFSPKTV
jgi:hypothetical protein